MEKKEEVKVSPMRAEIEAKITKYEQEAKAYELVGQLETASAIRKEIEGLNRIKLMY